MAEDDGNPNPNVCWNCGQGGLITEGTVGNYRRVCPHCDAQSPFADCPACGSSVPKKVISTRKIRKSLAEKMKEEMKKRILCVGANPSFRKGVDRMKRATYDIIDQLLQDGGD